MRVLSSILDLLYPKKCVFCGKLMDDKENKDDRVCHSCKNSLPTAEGASARSKGDFYKICVSCFYYDGKVRDSILRFKFNGKSSYCKDYAKFLSRCIEENLEGEYDVITWVPVSRKRYRKRGYDQSELLAKETAGILGKSAVCLLKKTVHNKPQSGIESAEKRKANVMGVYKAVNKDLIKGKRILIIDDIKTTGATLSECARTLLMDEAEEVLCATLAKTR